MKVYPNVIYLVILTLLLFQTPDAFAQATPAPSKVYKDRKLGIAFAYPSDMEMNRFANGVSIHRHKPGNSERFDISSGGHFYLDDGGVRPGPYFRRLRNARPGSFVLGPAGTEPYTKIENLLVDDYPAVKVSFDPRPQMIHDLSTVVGQSPIPIRSVVVFVLKEREFWVLSVTELNNRKITPEARKTFEDILQTFRFY